MTFEHNIVRENNPTQHFLAKYSQMKVYRNLTMHKSVIKKISDCVPIGSIVLVHLSLFRWPCQYFIPYTNEKKRVRQKG